MLSKESASKVIEDANDIELIEFYALGIVVSNTPHIKDSFYQALIGRDNSFLLQRL